MNYRLDYDEELPEVVRRLQLEHIEADRKLDRVSKIVSNKNKKAGNLKVAQSLLLTQRTEILRHAIEEEARLMREIMKSTETRKDSQSSLKILHEHRRIKEFLDDELPYLLDENSEKQARKAIVEFIDLMNKHHRSEEEETFPLALMAIL